MTRVLIVHGWGADSQSNWFPSLKAELEKKGMKVICPDLPNTDNPKKEEWLAAIKKLMGKFTKDDILVGHSLGCPTIVRLLEGFEKGEKVKAVILVSAFDRGLGINPIKNFVEDSFDYKKAGEGAEKMFVINSDDDPYIRLAVGQEMARRLGAQFIIEYGAGHINVGTGYFSYPRVLRMIEELTKK